MHVTQDQTRKLGTYRLTRDGLTVPNSAAITPAACWNFALAGAVVLGSDVRAPEKIYAAILDINEFVVPNVVRGLQPTATAANHPGCGPYLETLAMCIDSAIAGMQAAQDICRDAMVRIVAVKNGLTPCDNNDRYKLHMKGTTWFGWDHWALSVKPQQPGRPRIFVQTTTGTTLQHACNVIWDEDLPGVSIDIQELHAAQVGFLNNVTAYGNLCLVCGAAHGPARSNYANMWHRCTACRAVYCPTHAATLSGGRADRTRDCSRLACNGRTELLDMV